MKNLEKQIAIGCTLLSVVVVNGGLKYMASERAKELAEKKVTIERIARDTPDIELTKYILDELDDDNEYCKKRTWCLEKKFDRILREAEAANRSRLREVTVNVGLDGTPKWEAEDLMKKLSDEFEEKFKISFKVVGYHEHKLPESINTKNEGLKLKNKVTQKSEVYVFFTSTTDLRGKYKDYLGLATPPCGLIFIETNTSKDYNNMVLSHEAAHLFDVDHNDEEGTMMYPDANSKKPRWTTKTKREIIRNKFKPWYL